MLYLKQSTASQTVLIGPFVDSTDGVTAETALTIANTDIRLSKNGANIAAKNSGGGTHDENGWYQITLDATDTNTVGKLQLHCVMSGALPVWHEFWVLEENVYDAWFGPSAAAGTNLSAILTDTAEIGAAGAGLTEAGGTGDQLTAVPWNSAWDAEVQSEATDALNAYDPPTKAELDSGLAALNDISAAEVNAEVVDVLRTDTIPDSINSDGSAPTIAQAIRGIYQYLTERSVSGTTVTVKKEDGTTTLMSLTLNDGSSPTSVTRSG